MRRSTVDAQIAYILAVLGHLSAQVAPILTASGNDLVFQPGGPGNRPANVFALWAPLVAAANTRQGTVRILFDSTFAPCVIPAGNWNFSALGTVTFVAPFTAAVTIAAGATLSGVAAFDNVQLTYQGAGDCITVGNGQVEVFKFERVSSITCTGGGRFIATTGTGATEIFLNDNSQLVSGTCIGTTGAACTCAVVADDLSIIQANTLGAGTAATLQVNQASLAAVVSRTQAAMPGGVLDSTSLVQLQYSVPGVVTTRLAGNNSRIVSFQAADFTALDNLAHVAATIPINQFATTTGSRFDIFVQAALPAGGYMSASYRVKAQVRGGVVTATAVTTVDSDDVTATGWTFAVAVVGGNVTVTTTTANGAVTSVTVQQTAAVV